MEYEATSTEGAMDGLLHEVPYIGSELIKEANRPDTAAKTEEAGFALDPDVIVEMERSLTRA